MEGEGDGYVCGGAAECRVEDVACDGGFIFGYHFLYRSFRVRGSGKLVREGFDALAWLRWWHATVMRLEAWVLAEEFGCAVTLRV